MLLNGSQWERERLQDRDFEYAIIDGRIVKVHLPRDKINVCGLRRIELFGRHSPGSGQFRGQDRASDRLEQREITLAKQNFPQVRSKLRLHPGNAGLFNAPSSPRR
jgi:hypothetical protein